MYDRLGGNAVVGAWIEWLSVGLGDRWQTWWTARCLQFVRAIGAVLVLAMVVHLASAPAVRADNYDKEDLQRRDFSGQDISQDTFVKSNLKGADLSQVKGAGTSMFGANLRLANLQGADLTAATLDMADMRGADLTDAIFEESLMWLTKMEGATIDGADFTDALLRSDTHADLCKIATGINPVTGVTTRDSLDCD